MQFQVVYILGQKRGKDSHRSRKRMRFIAHTNFTTSSVTFIAKWICPQCAPSHAL
jgi:hypothetical protein